MSGYLNHLEIHWVFMSLALLVPSTGLKRPRVGKSYQCILLSKTHCIFISESLLYKTVSQNQDLQASKDSQKLSPQCRSQHRGEGMLRAVIFKLILVCSLPKDNAQKMFLVTTSQRLLLGRGQEYCTGPYNTQESSSPSKNDYVAQTVSHKEAKNIWVGECFSFFFQLS